MTNTRIIGIDPGYGRMGWGIIDVVGSKRVYVAHGCVETPASDVFLKRLGTIHKVLKHIITTYKPTHSGVEDLFFAKNAKTAMKVGQARGVILLTLFQAGLPVAEFTPMQIKQALTGYGNAEKAQIQYMVKTELHLKEIPKQDDAADALAVAITVSSAMKFAARSKNMHYEG